jgi:hypothetical protein
MVHHTEDISGAIVRSLRNIVGESSSAGCRVGCLDALCDAVPGESGGVAFSTRDCAGGWEGTNCDSAVTCSGYSVNLIIVLNDFKMEIAYGASPTFPL